MVRLLLIIALALAVLVLIAFVLGYNKIRSADVRVAEALSGIDVELTRRAALIPSLVQTVQAFASHEKAVLDQVTDARAALTTATGGTSVAQRAAAESGAQTGSSTDSEPSPDDPDADDGEVSHQDLLARELGARVIGEYENS